MQKLNKKIIVIYITTLFLFSGISLIDSTSNTISNTVRADLPPVNPMNNGTLNPMAWDSYYIQPLTATGTWIVPTGVSSIDILVVGGGGGAGLGTSTAGNHGGGGGAGGLVWIQGVTSLGGIAISPGNSISYSIGGGGAHAAINNLVLRPNAAGSHNDNSRYFNSAYKGVGDATNYQYADEAVANDTDYLHMLNGYTWTDTYNFQDFTPPPGAIINSVTETLRARGSGGSIQFESRTGTTDYNWGSTTTPTGSFTEYSSVAKTTNNAGGAWTSSDINNTQWGFYTHGNGVLSEISQVYITVSYTSVGSTGTKSTFGNLTAWGGGGGGSSWNRNGFTGGSGGGAGVSATLLGNGGPGNQSATWPWGAYCFGNGGASATSSTPGGGGGANAAGSGITGGTGKDLSAFFGTIWGVSGVFAKGGNALSALGSGAVNTGNGGNANSLATAGGDGGSGIILVRFLPLPTVTTNAATSVQATSATLNAIITAHNGPSCNAGFDYGTTTGYGSSTTKTPASFTLRPTGVGSSSSNTPQGDTPNWKCVDEAPFDGDITYVWYASGGGYTADFYTATDHTTQTGTIKNVTIYCVTRDDVYYGGFTWNLGPSLRIGGTYYGADLWQTVSGCYATYNRAWSINPYSGVAWTWSDIDNLEIGFYQQSGSPSTQIRTTQCYAIVYYNQTFSSGVTSLSPGTLYHYRANVDNIYGTGYGSDSTFLTQPTAPTSLIITNNNGNQQSLSWTHGTGYTNSVVRGQVGSYPANPQSGNAIYNGSSNTCINTGLTQGDTWYYRVWEFTTSGGLSAFSSTYAQGNLQFQRTGPYFISTWDTTKAGTSNSTSITLPIYNGGTYDFYADWGDSTTTHVTSYNQATHWYSGGGGVKTVNISGTIIGWRFNNGGDKLKLTDITKWGCLRVGNLNSYFYGCANLVCTATDALDLTGTTDTSWMFSGCTAFNGAINSWNVAAVTTMQCMFYGCTHFNQPLNSWNVIGCNGAFGMNNMFYGCTAFNGDIHSWNTANVKNMDHMFASCQVFNCDISGWNTGSVTTMLNMFASCYAFNQAIGGWNTAKVTTMSTMFNMCSAFNQPLNSWDVHLVTDFSYMFGSCILFNQNLNSWDMTGCTGANGISDMFSGCTAFNGDIHSWNTANIKNMYDVFSDCTHFNCDISGWNTGSATSMSRMFYGATIFNQAIGGWNTAKVTTMSYMFYYCTAFNQPLNSWDVHLVTDFSFMFRNCINFNQNLNSWVVTGCTSASGMTNMFNGATAFNGDIHSWDVHTVKNMASMFSGATHFNCDISGWVTTAITTLSSMFNGATAFNQNIGSWDVTHITTASTMFTGVTLSTTNYDALLNGWAVQAVPNSITFSGGNSKYSLSGKVGRDHLTAIHSWVITDGGQYIATPVVTTNSPTGVQTTNATLWGILTNDGGASCTVRFQYGFTTGYGSTTSDQTGKTTGNTFSAVISSLSKGRLYHYRAVAINSNGTGYGSDNILLTKPDALTGFTATRYSATQVNLTWTNNTGGDGAFIRYAKQNPPPYLYSSGGTNNVNCGHGSSLNLSTGDFTISYWINYTGSLEINQLYDVLGKCNGDSNNPGFLSWVSTYGGGGTKYGIIFTTTNGAWGDGLMENANNYYPNTWYNIVATRVGTTWSLYKDGVFVKSITATGIGVNVNSANDFKIFDCTSYPGMTGCLDDVYVYGRALTSTEISNLYNHIDPASTNLKGHWAMNEGTGSTTADSSGNGNTGTITGATWKNWVDMNPVPANGAWSDGYVLFTNNYHHTLTPGVRYYYNAWTVANDASQTSDNSTAKPYGGSMNANVFVYADVYVDDNAPSGWYDATHVHTVQQGVDAATSGQSIYVYGGTYREPAGGTAHILIANKTLTIVGEPNDIPKICPSMSNATNQYIIYFSGIRYSLTLKYLDISNEWGGATTPVHYGIYVPSQNNLIIDHCVLHDINQVIKCYGNVTFTNNTAYHYKYRVLEGSWSAATYALHFVCKYNQIYDAVVTGINNEAIKPKYGHWYGDISYNYIAGCRVGIWIDEEGGGPLCKFGGNWTVSHNTIVSRYDPSNPDDIEQAISLTSTSDNFSKIHIRDNLISGCGYYAIHLGMYSVGYPYSDKTTIQNCLFWNYYTYWNDTVMHRARYLNLTNQLYFQWNGTGYSTNIKYGHTAPHTICGWGYNTSAGHLLTMQNCIVNDPLFVNVSGTPATRWALQYGSPAVGTATDGTNIGAWQGTPDVKPLFIANEYPGNNTHGNPLSVDWHALVDPIDIVNWTIQCSNGQRTSGTGDVGGIKFLPLSGLLPLTTYTVWVNATNGTNWTRAKFYFTTDKVQPAYPTNFTEIDNHLVLYPNSDLRKEWSVSGATNHYEAVNTTDSKYIYSSASISAVDKFGLTNHTTQTGTIIDVVLHVSLKASSIYDYPNWGVSNGTTYWWSNGTIGLTATYAWYNTSIGSLSPWSGLPWTWKDIDMLTACIVSTGEKVDSCDRFYVDVLYTPLIIIDETPIPVTSYAHVYSTYLNVFVSNPNNQHMNISLYWANATYLHTMLGVVNGTTANLSVSSYILPHPWLAHDTTYYWYVLVQGGTSQAHGAVYVIHTSKAWDCDENKVVNYLDVSTVVFSYSTSGFIPGGIPADIIEDGVVNYLDASSVMSHYSERY